MKKTLPNITFMKRMIPVVAVAALMTACNSTPRPTTTTDNSKVVYMDTTGLSQFQAWKAQNELAAMNQYYMGGQPAMQSNNGTVSNSSGSSARRTSTSTARRTSGTTASRGTTAQQKKGWSKAAKGAVIGGVAGAAGGAVINKKNRALGAVIGGVIGAAGGYGIGRGMDKRDGRY